VTGASSGIGAATALALAAQGAGVSLVARRKERLDIVAGTIREAKGRALVVEADIRGVEQVQAAVSDTLGEFGRLDTLVNCAGVMLLGPVLDAPLVEWDRMLGTNLAGLLNCVHAALPHLLRAAERDPRYVADIVNVSSVAGRFPRAGYAVYNATKHGVNGFSEALRQEVGGRGVRVSVVEPGAVRTELHRHSRPEVRSIPSAEALRPEDIADVVTYIVTRPRRVAVNEILVRPSEGDATVNP
jgi:NADP-dependent 3-hydroxy acid dehydrogenase YdfG